MEAEGSCLTLRDLHSSHSCRVGDTPADSWTDCRSKCPYRHYLAKSCFRFYAMRSQRASWLHRWIVRRFRKICLVFALRSFKFKLGSVLAVDCYHSRLFWTVDENFHSFGALSLSRWLSWVFFVGSPRDAWDSCWYMKCFELRATARRRLPWDRSNFWLVYGWPETL